MPGSTSCSTTACSTRRCSALGSSTQPLAWLATDTAVYIGIVYSYLPFMVLPLYASSRRWTSAARGRGRPRLPALEGVLAGHAAAVAAGRVAGALLCFIPIVGEFVIPDLLGGSRHADDRPDAVDASSSRTATGRSPRPSRSCCWSLLLVPIVIYQHLQARELGGALMRRGLSTFNVIVGRARARLPLPADRDPGDLFVQRLAAGRRSGAAGRRAGTSRCSTTGAMLDAAWVSLRIALLSATAATVLGHAGRARAGARRAASAGARCSPAWSMRRW